MNRCWGVVLWQLQSFQGPQHSLECTRLCHPIPSRPLGHHHLHLSHYHTLTGRLACLECHTHNYNTGQVFRYIHVHVQCICIPTITVSFLYSHSSAALLHSQFRQLKADWLVNLLDKCLALWPAKRMSNNIRSCSEVLPRRALFQFLPRCLLTHCQLTTQALLPVAQVNITQ